MIFLFFLHSLGCYKRAINLEFYFLRNNVKCCDERQMKAKIRPYIYKKAINKKY
jgi:hypothetical protein